MLRSINREHAFSISKLEVVNSSGAFLRVTCNNVSVDKTTLSILQSYNRWEIEGKGNFFKTKRPPVVDSKLHAPADGRLAGTLTYDMTIELFFPPGAIEINFGPIPPTPLPFFSSSSSSSPEISNGEVFIIPVEDTRDFDNLDLE